MKTTPERDPNQLHLVEPLTLPRSSMRYAFARNIIPATRAPTPDELAAHFESIGYDDFDARR